MFDNQTAGGYVATDAKVGRRPLESIGTAADRLYGIGDRIEAFLSRFNGSPDVRGGAVAGAAPVAMVYSNELSRLHGNLDRAEHLLESLDQIG